MEKQKEEETNIVAVAISRLFRLYGSKERTEVNVEGLGGGKACCAGW